MRRSNYIVGFTVSVIIHGALIVFMVRGENQDVDEPYPVPITPVRIAAIAPRETVPLVTPTIEDLPVKSSIDTVAVPELESSPAQPPKGAGGSAFVPEVVDETPSIEQSEVTPEPVKADPVPTENQPTHTSPAPKPTPPLIDVKASPPVETEPVSQPVEPPEIIPAPVQKAPSAVSEAVQSRLPSRHDDRPSGGRIGPDDADIVPPLRVYWEDATELISVARALGFRLAAVDRKGSIIGEVDLSRRPSLRDWAGLPYGYSNRVRMLSPSIFSPPLAFERPVEVAEIWIFVPMARDRAMIAAQHEALRRAGLRPEEAASMDGHFARSTDGSYRLLVTKTRPRTEGIQNDG